MKINKINMIPCCKACLHQVSRFFEKLKFEVMILRGGGVALGCLTCRIIMPVYILSRSENMGTANHRMDGFGSQAYIVVPVH